MAGTSTGCRLWYSFDTILASFLKPLWIPLNVVGLALGPSSWAFPWTRPNEQKPSQTKPKGWLPKSQRLFLHRLPLHKFFQDFLERLGSSKQNQSPTFDKPLFIGPGTVGILKKLIAPFRSLDRLPGAEANNPRIGSRNLEEHHTLPYSFLHRLTIKVDSPRFENHDRRHGTRPSA